MVRKKRVLVAQAETRGERLKLDSVVILGPWFRSYLECVARAFEENGVQAASFAYPEPPVGLWQTMAWEILPRRGLTNFRSRLLDRAVQSAREAAKTAQLLLLVKADAIPLAQYAALLESVECPKVIWLMDSVHGVAEGLERASMADSVLYFEGTDSSALEALEVPCHHVAMAADPYWYRPLGGVQTRWDVSFIGQLYDNRLSLLESILGQLPPGLPLQGRFVGSFRSYAHPLRASRRLSSYPVLTRHLHHGSNWTHDQINRLNNETRICMNILHPQSADSLNPRTFETCCSGAFLLCQSNTALAQCFKVGKEVESFASPAEAAEKISFYLRNPSAAKPIAEAGRQRVMRDHTMGVRVGQILSLLEEDLRH